MIIEARYIQVKKYILRGVKEHRWNEGERVSSENELVKACSVSRMTARRAVKELTSEGVLVSRQGQGTFVASAKSRSSVMTIRNIADEINERNHKHHCEVVNLEAVNLSDNNDNLLLKQFGSYFINSKNELIFFSRIIHFENDEPIQIEERFVNPSLAPEYLKQDFLKFTPNEYLMKVCPVSEAEHRVEAVMPSLEQSQWLKIGQQQPCLKISRTTYSDEDIASFALLFHPGNRFQLGNHIKLKEDFSNV
ncbi:MAG: GntR family histidine utilization transcriptional repressor [Enterobacterales bacterium]|jgi:GntR family histidine utilization transcriptional repressor